MLKWPFYWGAKIKYNGINYRVCKFRLPEPDKIQFITEVCLDTGSEWNPKKRMYVLIDPKNITKP